MSLVAPRTPDTDTNYDCSNDTNTAEKLANDIAVANLAQAASIYDAALAATAAAEGNVEQKRAEVEKQRVNVEFLKAQLLASQNRKAELENRFNVANAEALACNDVGTCTVAEKEIKVLTSNNAANQMIDNNADIAKYTTDIVTEEATYLQISTAFVGIEAGAQPAIQAAQADEIAKQTTYVTARAKAKATQEEFDELHDKCKVDAFHANQERLDDMRTELLKFGIQIEVSKTVAEENPGLSGSIPGAGGNTNVGDGKDCRYRDIPQCQGIGPSYINGLTEQQRETCRTMITPECFNKTYETDWQLDFWSFLFILPAIAVCIFEEDFSYGLCVGSSAYVMNLKYLQTELGIPF